MIGIFTQALTVQNDTFRIANTHTERYGRRRYFMVPVYTVHAGGTIYGKALGMQCLGTFLTAFNPQIGKVTEGVDKYVRLSDIRQNLAVPLFKILLDLLYRHGIEIAMIVAVACKGISVSAVARWD